MEDPHDQRSVPPDERGKGSMVVLRQESAQQIFIGLILGLLRGGQFPDVADY
jgi:hypothetical protein